MNRLSTYKRRVAINVDPQIDFMPGGALGVDEGNQVIEPLNRINEFVLNEARGTVVLTGDQHPAQTPHFDKWRVHCVKGTEGAEFHPDLTIQPGYLFIDKGMGTTDGYSGFEGRTRDGITLEQIITPENHNDRTAVIMGGIATDYCVLATALDAVDVASKLRKAGRGVIDIFLAVDAVRAVNLQPGDGDRALEKMQAAGVILTTTDDLFREINHERI